MIKKQVNYYLKNYKINRMKHQATLGTFVDDEDTNGVPYQKFQSSNISFWYGEYRININQQSVEPNSDSTLLISSIKNITVRHDFVQKNIKMFEQFNVLKLKDGVFDILSIDSDDQVNGLDVLTIKKDHMDVVDQPENQSSEDQ